MLEAVSAASSRIDAPILLQIPLILLVAECSSLYIQLYQRIMSLFLFFFYIFEVRIRRIWEGKDL